MKYAKYIAWLLVDWLFYILQFIFFFPNYWSYLLGFRIPVIMWFFHWNNPYGYRHERYWKHYGKEKWWVAWKWNCIRNSHWWFKTEVWTPLFGKITKLNYLVNSFGIDNAYSMPPNENNPGKIHLTYTIDNKKEYFFYARCLPWKNLLGKWVFLQIHCGAQPNYRYTLKIRFLNFENKYASIDAFYERHPELKLK
tara:strand:- start:3562 stop:4146 length:585 start_codon:yes stop_codon:yes gene_type:complete